MASWTPIVEGHGESGSDDVSGTLLLPSRAS